MRRLRSFQIGNLIAPHARGLALCLLGGLACNLMDTPLPWMIGPLLAMATARIFGANVDSPRGGRQTGQLIIGCALGLYFTPVVMQTLLSHAVTLVVAALVAIFLGYVCGLVLAKLSGVDKATAFFASAPGGAAEMSVIAERNGASVHKVAMAQSLRIMLVVVVVPSALTLSGAHGTDPYQASPGAVEYPGLALLLLLCVVGALVLSRFKLPNAWMLAPLFVGIAVTVTGTELSAIPLELSNAGQLLLGCALGARFEEGFIKRQPRYVIAVVASVLIAIVLFAASGAALGYLAGIAVPTMILATAPGGIGEMGITAQVLQLGVPLVTAFHLTLLVLLVTITAPLFRLARHYGVKLGRRRNPR